MKDYIYPTKLATDLEFFLKCEKGLVRRWVKWYDLYIYESTLHTTYTNYTDICAAAAITAKARVKLYELILYLQNKVHICLLNTDEIIYSHKQPIIMPTTWNTKSVQIKRTAFEAKKAMFFSKRLSKNDIVTRPYNHKNGMLL
jgi:hypothetical protein